ncbi:MAG: MerC family mercury resistance protein [Burkholderiales bacterium]
MHELIKQFASLGGSAFAAACCLGATAALSALAAIGAGFLINDAILIPAYAALLALSLWLLYRSARAHGDLRPFWLGVAGSAVALGGLFAGAQVVVAGLTAMVAGSLWDFCNLTRRRSNA